ncbi:LytR C-terminal domain-containing protein [Massilia sp. YIM B02763]|uniref:LytR C-terminal domain-containing protein n=1 Tax=Massilia sp. YIM B02763 TaxID=3050130 RepID=UPI0025B65BFB|nr:LytR C-terminal domain-containing protein [Massilia sp. YIM B02763]MDN4053700.1 LytR C-terminal domain-containing protein [Massilia sp. YIM B02763]
MQPSMKRPRILLTSLSLLCAGALLPACSSSPGLPAAADAAGAQQASADEHYQRGRSLHLAHRRDDAIAAYQAALRRDPGHVNAGNGLAIAYAERRDFDHAIPIWTALTRDATMASGPAVGFLFSNLGYAYLLSGDHAAAQAALEKACLLDPLNARAWQNLGETLQRLGQDERARLMLRQAIALREHDLRADYAMVAGQRPAPIAQALAQPQQQSDGDWAFIDIESTGNGMYALRRVPATRKEAPAPAPQPAVEEEDGTAVAALEISNGNGRQGLARLLSRQLRDPGVKVVRLSNQKGFAVRQTRVEYQPAFRNVAERLAQRFDAGAPVRMGTPGRPDVRLVIGHDLPPQRIVARPRPSGDALASTGAP